MTIMMMIQVISPVTSDDSDDDSDVFDDCSEEAVDCASILRAGQFLCLDLDIDPDTQQVRHLYFWLLGMIMQGLSNQPN